MWKNRIQSTSSGSKASGGQTRGTSLQHLSPFASHSTAETVGTPSSTSPKPGPELPSGVRYIRQTPTTITRPVSGQRVTPTTSAKQRDRSPGKALRFADPDPKTCSKRHGIETPKTVTKVRSHSQERLRSLVRPVISAEPNSGECKRFSSHKQKVVETVATSPATRQTSPIFSCVDFGGDTIKRTDPSKPTSTTNSVPKYRIDATNGSTHNSTQNSGPTVDRHTERQPLIKTEIKTPNGTVLKRSSAVNTKVGTNGTRHRNTVSFPINTTSERTLDQNRLSVNVNVAVGLDCNDRFSDQRFMNQMDEEVNSIQGEDEVDMEWAPLLESGNQFQMVVAIRLRPFLQKEVDTKNNIPVVEMNGSTVRIINSDNDNYNRTEFGFDVCLNSSDRDLFDYADQDLVFKKLGEPLLERALEGYNVCLFAYGQTGSGKSFTMTGTDSNPGIIPRFVHELYKRIQSLTEVLFAVEVSYYEIYNEKIYDLLSDDKNYNKKILRIREHPQTGPYVENLTQHTVEDFDEVMHLLRSGSRRRATASTAINADSSRSHSIFTIILSQLKNNSDEMGLDMSCSCGSRINLIDLAGSERVGVSATTGGRMKEGSLINKSLLNLGKVISKLAEYSAHPTKSAHIPYRDSPLTWLLRESLGGNSQTSMIATISPAKCHLEETMSTLRYAATARRIVNFVHINEDPKTKKIRELMEIIADLRAKQTLQELDRKDKPISKGSSEELSSDTITSPDLKTSSSEPKSSTDNSFDSQESTKSVEKKSIATNTSFVFDRRKSTKGTETSFVEPVVEPIIKKSTASIATNTSFVKPSKTVCSTGTDAHRVKTPPKPKTVDTGIGMSFIESVDTSTNTNFVEQPSNLDLYKFKRLEDMQRQLLEDIRKYKDKVIEEVSAKVDEWSNFGSVGAVDNLSEKSESISDNIYYECEQSLQSTESLDSSHTYVVSKDTTDRTTSWAVDVNLQPGKQPSNTGAIPKVRKQTTDQSSAKKKDKKDNKKDKKKDNKKDTDNNDWGTDAKKCDSKSSDWTQNNWNNDSKEQNKVVSIDKKKKSPQKKDNCDEWGQQVNQKSTKNTANEWSVDTNEQKKEENVTKTNVTTGDDWGTDTNNKTEKSTDKKEDNEWGDEWGQQTQDKDQNQSWDTAAAADQSSKESSDKKNKKKDKKKNKKNKDKDKEKNESFDWGTDDKNQTEDKANDDWGTDTVDKSPDDNKDDKQTGGDDNEFDWGTDTTDTTVIVKKELSTVAEEDEVW